MIQYGTSFLKEHNKHKKPKGENCKLPTYLVEEQYTMKNLIYDFSIHSLYYADRTLTIPYFSLAIDTLELLCNSKDGTAIGVQGFLPLVKAMRGRIHLPSIKGNCIIKEIELSKVRQYMVYDFARIKKSNCKYFEPIRVTYDRANRIILVGNDTTTFDIAGQASENLICGFDKESNLKALYIFPDQFV